MTFYEPLKCRGFVETVEYENSEIIINQIKKVTTKICPLRDECYRYCCSKHRGFVEPSTVGSNCVYFMKIKQDPEFGYKYY